MSVDLILFDHLTWSFLTCTTIARTKSLKTYNPGVEHGTWRWWFPKGISFSKGWFSGSMLKLRFSITFNWYESRTWRNRPTPNFWGRWGSHTPPRRHELLSRSWQVSPGYWWKTASTLMLTPRKTDEFVPFLKGLFQEEIHLNQLHRFFQGIFVGFPGRYLFGRWASCEGSGEEKKRHSGFSLESFCTKESLEEQLTIGLTKHVQRKGVRAVSLSWCSRTRCTF